MKIRVGLLVPKKDKYKVCSVLDKAHPDFLVQVAEDSQFCQTLRYQNRSKGLVWHYINIDAMEKRIPSFSKNLLLHKYLVLHVYKFLETYPPTQLIGPTRSLISDKTFTYTIIRSYTIIWQVRVVTLNTSFFL